MNYISTRGKAPALGFEDVLLTGLASDGGLYVPAELPRIDAATLSRLETNPPAALYGAPPARQKSVIRNPETLSKLGVTA